ncbi:hypothetical protein GCM10027591_03830 [Zhihengliuella somnathii]
MTGFDTVTIHGTEHLRLTVAGVIYAIPRNTESEIQELLTLSKQASAVARRKQHRGYTHMGSIRARMHNIALRDRLALMKASGASLRDINTAAATVLGWQVTVRDVERAGLDSTLKAKE